MIVEMVGGPDDGKAFGVSNGQTWLTVPIFVEQKWTNRGGAMQVPSWRIVVFYIHKSVDDATRGTVYWSERIYSRENL